MNPNLYLMLFAKMAISVSISFVLLRTLSRPLGDTLARLCPDAPSASFWLCYTRLMLVIAPLLLVLVVDLLTRHTDPLDSLRLTLMAALAGLLIGLRAVGKRLGRFVVLPQHFAGDAS